MLDEPSACRPQLPCGRNFCQKAQMWPKKEKNEVSGKIGAGSGYSVLDLTEMFLVLTGRKTMLEPSNSCRHSQRALPLPCSSSAENKTAKCFCAAVSGAQHAQCRCSVMARIAQCSL
jgi:hypothetical protein